MTSQHVLHFITSFRNQKEILAAHHFAFQEFRHASTRRKNNRKRDFFNEAGHRDERSEKWSRIMVVKGTRNDARQAVKEWLRTEK
jgi:hypothetical protein